MVDFRKALRIAYRNSLLVSRTAVPYEIHASRRPVVVRSDCILSRRKSVAGGCSMVYHDPVSIIFYYKGVLNLSENNNLPTWFRNPLNNKVTTKVGSFDHNPYWEAQPLGKNHVMVKITFAYEHFKKHNVNRFVLLFFEKGYNEVIDHIIKGPKDSRRELARRKEDKKILLFTPLGMTCPESKVTRNKDGKFEKLMSTWNAYVLVSSDHHEVKIIKDIIKSSGNTDPTTFIFGINGSPSEKKWERVVSSEYGDDYLTKMNSRKYRMIGDDGFRRFFADERWKHLRKPEFDFQREIGYLKWLRQRLQGIDSKFWYLTNQK